MKKKISFFTFLCILHISLQCYSQNGEYNSTRQIVPKTTIELFDQLKSAVSIAQKADIYFWLSWKYMNVMKMDSAQLYCAKVKEVCTPSAYEPGMGKYFLANARLSFLLREFSESLAHFTKALEIFNRYNDVLLLGLTHKFMALNYMGLESNKSEFANSRYHIRLSIDYLSRLPASGELAHAYQVYGNEHFEMYQIDSAVFYFIAAFRSAEKANSPRIIFNSNYFLSELYLSLHDWDKAYEHLQLAFRVPAHIPEKVMMRSCLGVYAICLIEKKDFVRADSVIKQYTAMNKVLGDIFGEMKLLQIRGAYEFGKRNFPAAVKYFSEVYTQLWQSEGRTGFEFVDIVFRLARAEYEIGNYTTATRHFWEVLRTASKIGSGVYAMNAKFELGRTYNALGKMDSAYYFMRAHSYLKDSLLSMQKQRAAVELMANYETEKQEQQIKLLQQQGDLKSALAARESQRKNFAYIVIATVLVFGGYGFFRYLQHKRLSKKLSASLAELKETQHQLIRIEKEKEAENIRSSISRDIHDEVGATLSGVALYSEIAKQKMKEHKDTDVNTYLDHISTNSKEMVQKMSDIVWAINPENDSFGRIMSKLQALAINLCAGKNIRLHTSIDNIILDEHPEMQVRKNIYLFIKEAMNNAVKYSGGKNLYFSLRRQDETIIAEVRDDGHGFDRNAVVTGNGLNNMRIRANELNGTFSVQSAPAQGTCIQLQFNFHPAGGHRKVV